MANTGIDKYPREVKVAAIKRLQEGGRGVLTAISKELGCKKSTVKYWWDNKEKILTNGEVPVGMNNGLAVVQNDAIKNSWLCFAVATNEIQASIKEASFENKMKLWDMMASRLPTLKPADPIDESTKNQIYETQRQVYHSTRVEVRSFASAQEEKNQKVIDAVAEEDEKKDLATPPPEHETESNNKPDKTQSGTQEGGADGGNKPNDRA